MENLKEKLEKEFEKLGYYPKISQWETKNTKNYMARLENHEIYPNISDFGIFCDKKERNPGARNYYFSFEK